MTVKFNDKLDFSKKIERVIPDLDLPEDVLKYQGDKQTILKGLISAIIAQEISRIVVTRKPMNVNALEEINKDRLASYWNTLAHHYRGGKYQKIFENGTAQLNKVSSEEIAPLVQQLQYAIEPILNEEMSQKTLNFALKIPFLGRIGLGSFRFSVTGPRTAIKKFQLRALRITTEWCIWAATILGAVHWFVWTIFNSSYLAYQSKPATSAILMVLLICTTLMVWLCLKNNGLIVSRINTKFINALYIAFGWFVVGFGWLYWILWTLTDLPGTIYLLETILKTALPIYFVSAALIGWIVGRISPKTFDNGET